MAQFDVYRRKDDERLLVDCQSDFIGELATRFVIPLYEPGQIAPPITRLNPLLDFEGRRLILYPQFAFSVRRSLLGPVLGSLSHEHDAIMGGIDMLLTGY
ncbi:CcdB family protein [Sphingomonas sp. DT-204]|uniref:CcdB family protein n=1 Tax=Sphingomonas sp. DT-204 TaxID=3396166 RepID=UPI003F1D9E51